MQIQQQVQQLEKQQERYRLLRQRYMAIVIVTFFVVAVGAVTGLLSILGAIHGFWFTILAVGITILGGAGTLFIWLFPISVRQLELYTSFFLTPSMKTIEVPSYPILYEQLPSADEKLYRDIIGIPPPTIPKIIQSRTSTVEYVYTRLIRDDISALVLTGIGGVGKSTLAALICHYAEEQRSVEKSPFSDKSIWIKIDATVTIRDLTGTLSKALNMPIPDLDKLTPYDQALTVFKALNQVDKAKLVVIDQFHNLQDCQTGYILRDRPGFSELLDMLNSQPCTSRVLLTSRSWLRRSYEQPPVYMQEYLVSGLEETEGVELLQKQGIMLKDKDLHKAVARCDGHALALTLLASLLRRNPSVSLATILKDPMYTQLWIKDIANDLLDYMYMKQLTDIQRKLLTAFSIYRDAVQLDAALAVLNVSDTAQKMQLLSAFDVLLEQHLFKALGKDYYQLNAIIIDYAKEHLDESSNLANQQALQSAHAKAARYYLQQAVTSFPPQGKRQRLSDVKPLIEAAWHLCQAGQRQEALDLIQREELFSDLRYWGSNGILLELCQLLLPSHEWEPERSQEASIYSNLAWALDGLGEKEDALKYYKASLHICEVIRDREEEAWTRNNLGRVYTNLRRSEEALKSYEMALRIFQERGDQRGEGTTLNNLGRLYSTLGKKKEAIKYYEDALRIREKLEDKRGIGKTLKDLGKVYADLGQKEEANVHLEKALQIRKEVGDLRREGRTRNNLGRSCRLQGQYDQALEHLKRALEISQNEDIKDRWGEGKVLNNLGLVYLDLHDNTQALQCFKSALDICQEINDRLGEGWALHNLGQVYAALGAKEEALEYFERALNIRREEKDHRGEGWTLYNIGMLLLEQGQELYRAALACFLLARDIFGKVDSPDLDKPKHNIEELRKKMDEEEFAELLNCDKSKLFEIVELALEGMPV